MVASTTDVVPMAMPTLPLDRAPVASAAAWLSVIPARTWAVVGSPVAAATSARTVPTTSSGRTRGGSREGSTPERRRRSGS